MNAASARRNQLVTVAMVFSVFTGFALGRASPGSASETEIGKARSCVLPRVPLGPSEVWSQSSSLVAESGSSRSVAWSRYSPIS